MRLLIDMGHPAHVHLFRNFIRVMEERGHTIKLTARDKDITFYLLNHYDLDFESRGQLHGKIIGKAIYMFSTDRILHRITKKFDPDILMGVHNPYVAHIGALLEKEMVIFTDTEHSKLASILCFPFVSRIITPTCYLKDLGRKQQYYNGYHELAYLHPDFYTPDPSVLDMLGVRENEPYVILRFVTRKSIHDMGYRGLDIRTRLRIIHEFSKYARVFISSEGAFHPAFERYRMNIPPERIHDALHYATMLYAESATMTSEAAILGTPTIYINNVNLGYTLEEEKKYGLVTYFDGSIDSRNESIRKGLEILRSNVTKEHWKNKAKRLLGDKINVTRFMVRLMEKYDKCSK